MQIRQDTTSTATFGNASDALVYIGAFLVPILVCMLAVRQPSPPKITYKYIDVHGQVLAADNAHKRLQALAADRQRQLQQTNAEAETLRRKAASAGRPITNYSLDSSWSAAGSGSNSESVYVRGHTRNNGAYVRPHYRSTSNNTDLDNWSVKGNSNPMTGRRGSRTARR